MSSTSRLWGAWVAVLVLLAGCAEHLAPPGPRIVQAAVADGAFVMPDGMRLPYRTWLPEGAPKAVVLALHGMNDSRDAWEYPGPDFAKAGLAVFAPDQRGFGATASRGFWPETEGLVDDVRTMAALLHARYPGVRTILIGESMGAAVLMVAATSSQPPDADAYVLIAPAVWGRAKMNPFMRAALWTAGKLTPGWHMTGRGFVKIRASDNIEALRRLSRNPLTLFGARVDALRGVVDLMDAALAAAQRFDAPSLFLYGGHDQVIPLQATKAVWGALPPGPVRAFYPDGYHLLLRDLRRDVPIRDIVTWIGHPDYGGLPSGAHAGFAGK
jgi:alpha-beta hydrolase superfamily lysophospholipase